MPSVPTGPVRAPNRGHRDRERRCLVTGARRPAGDMVRFAVAPDGAIVPDVAGRLPGRGLWLTASRDIVERARVRGRFAKATDGTVTVADDLAGQVEALLAKRSLESIGLARRAGKAVAGHDKVRAAIARGRVALLLLASDGAPEGCARMRTAAGDVPVVELFTGAELGRAFGRDNTVFAAIADSALAARLADDARRLQGFRDDPTAGK